MPRARVGPAQRRGVGDAGSTLIMAMVIMTILATLTLALQARTLSSLKYMRHSQDYDAALAAADAGLAKAVYRIENGQTASWPEDGTSGAGRYKFYGENVGNLAKPTDFIVSVRGRVGDANHAVRALVTRDALFPYALFGFQGLTIDGSTSAGSAMNFSVSSTVDVTGAGVLVGSNGMLTCRGATAPNVLLRSAGGFSGCPPSQ